MENIINMCAPGYPVSGVAAARTVKPIHWVETAAFQRSRVATTNVAVPQMADLVFDPSASTSELRT